MAKEELKGIGGWLILPTIGLLLGILLYSFLTILYAIDISSSFDVLLVLLLGVSTGITFYTLRLEFKESKRFPRWYIFYLWFGLFVAIMISFGDVDYTSISSSIIFAVIWTWYIKVSKRVKNTFVK
ncbi:hypothetical protein CMI40_01720 [Candidatus Pacearchaeota archaeon]|nr:hypothetical protein [Candidatus Pacearchaeota archaeon]|tara:strand:+ start:76 stop:453 length:378 start_codon:yes stop_codon:yes gene_type:complete